MSLYAHGLHMNVMMYICNKQYKSQYISKQTVQKSIYFKTNSTKINVFQSSIPKLNNYTITAGYLVVCVYECMHMCVVPLCVCTSICVCVCVCARTRVCTCTFVCMQILIGSLLMLPISY